MRPRFFIHALISVLFLAIGLRAAATASTGRQTSGAARDAILVLPFENTSNLREYNWVGESFADSLSELLGVPGLAIISSDERAMLYQRINLPLTTLPTRATAIKLGREARATMVLVGTYSVNPVANSRQVQVQGTARLIKVGEGRYEGRLIGDSEADRRWATNVFDFGGALVTLQEMQGRIAYQILYERDRALPFSRNQFIERATKVPQRAFESYVKGFMTSDAEKRKAYLTNAVREYERVTSGQTYPQAAFELGNLYFIQKDWKQAAENFSKIEKNDYRYAEAAFYAGLAYWRMNDPVRALGALVPLTAETPLTIVYNNAGAISLQAARDERRPDERVRLLTQSLRLLERAAQSSPDDPFVRFNYGYALFLAGKHAEVPDQLRPVITADPRDGQSYFLFAKALERAGRSDPAATADNEARRYLPAYAKWQTEWQKDGTVTGAAPRLYQTFNRQPYIDKRREETAESQASNGSGAEARPQELLANARELYKDGRDDEALPELRRVLVIEPMSAEAYLLIGRIYQRRGDLDAAISALKTAVFWDAKLIDAHILLGRIFLARGDRAMATTYANSAIQIDANNQEAVALHRQTTIGSK